ncbi:hypothetical protein ACXYMU_00670 [Pontibacter sp. CAU 1760]
MANDAYNNDRTDNQEIGRRLYDRENRQNENRHQQRYAPRGDADRERKWDEGNYFHTGPSPRGAQDRDSNDYRRGGSSHSAYNQGQNAPQSDHYGSRTNSSYRNERSYIDHGDHGSSHYQHDERHSMRRPHTEGGSLQGSHDDRNTQRNDPWREGPGSRSRYKEDDFRYGSGSHNWYRENRYTPDSGEHRSHDERGIMDRVKDTWNDIWHSDDAQYQNRGERYTSDSDRLDSHRRYGSEGFRDRSFDRGYEGGPRWADESDSDRRSH